MSSSVADPTWTSAPVAIEPAPMRREADRARHVVLDRLLPTIRLSGVRLHAITESQCIDRILDSLGRGEGGVVVTPNLDHLRRARKDVSFAALLDDADLVVADGMPLVWASRIQRTPLPQRVAG